VHEAKRYGAIIQLPCVNRSNYKTTIYKRDIYLGFIHITGLQNNLATTIEEIRNTGGPYSDLADFVARTGPGLEQITLLIRSGAFRFTGKKKAVLLWEAHMLINSKQQDYAGSLFFPAAKSFSLPNLEYKAIEDAYDEIELLGFPVSMTWFDMLETGFRGEIAASAMKENIGQRVRMVGHLATVKYIKTIRNDWMNFGCFIDPENEFFDSTHFPQSLANYPFKGSGTYLILGKIVEEFGYPSIEVEKMAKLPVKPDSRY
jgi:DNA polymerase III alpha subunit